ncbi:MAG: sulfatase-like hydrolase/transferase, partial [Acidimicrobiales bacterium]|nr:sulfatase-like hydrolase/transferase [Acidimicrobiales bacterium]
MDQNTQAQSAADRPNVVFILADDLGSRDLGCYGSDEVRSPVIDQMAADGIRFTHAYAASPWCSPTRIALYTGRSPGRLEGGLEEPLRTRSEEMGLPPEHPTIASLLVQQGYSTAMFGKWHCGWAPWFGPNKSGFQTFFGNLDGAVDYHGHFGTLGEPDMWENEEPVEVEGYYTDLISQRTADYIRANASGPFYVQVNYTAPHWPWEGRDDADISAEILREYRDGEVPVPILHLAGGSIAKYVEMIQLMDEGIGQILDAIDEAGVRDNTLVIFASDNGGERWSNNWPYVGEKGDVTEGGIRVPLVARWPAVIEPGQTSEAPNITMDWTATILEAAGAEPHADYPLDGVSLLDWLSGEVPYPQHDLF